MNIKEAATASFFFFMEKRQSSARARAKKNVEPQTQIELKEKPVPRVKSRHFRKAAKDEIEKNYHAIVEELGKKARDGSIQHTKLLLGLGGIEEKAGKTPPKRRRGPSLGKLLLEEAERAMREGAKTSDSDDATDQK